jgi:uncharacterized membrane protein
LLPEKSEPVPVPLPLDRENVAPLRLPIGGYVQAIDFDRLVPAATEANGLVELVFRPGHHGIPGGVYGWISPASARTERLEKEFASSLVVGPVRTEYQDLEYSVRQLVELSLRALSPGINDPYTALAALDRLARSLAVIMARGPAQERWCDKDGNVRVAAPVVTFEGLVDEALTQIRQVAAANPAILIKLAEMIGQLLPLSTLEQARVLHKHLASVDAAGRRNIADDGDLAALDERIAAARRTAAGGTTS